MNALGFKEGGVIKDLKAAPFVTPAMEKAIKKMNRDAIEKMNVKIPCRRAAKSVVTPIRHEVNLGGEWLEVTKELFDRMYLSGNDLKHLRYSCNNDFEEAKRKEKTMAMSKDRVRFSVPISRFQSALSGCDADTYSDIVCDTMGMKRNDLRCAVSDAKRSFEDRIHFVCRPSQFARFVIARNDAGLCNRFKEIEPGLFTPEREAPKPYDVSENPA